MTDLQQLNGEYPAKNFYLEEYLRQEAFLQMPDELETACMGARSQQESI
jgi:hypothetical protein